MSCGDQNLQVKNMSKNTVKSVNHGTTFLREPETELLIRGIDPYYCFFFFVDL